MVDVTPDELLVAIVDHPGDGPIGVVRVIGVGVLIGDALEGGLVVGFAG